MTPLPMPEPPAGMPEFTNEQVRALTDYMEAAGRSRGYEQGAEFSEVDYLAGCMATLFALKQQNHIPASWIFDTIAGKSPLDLPELDREVTVVHDPRALRQTITLYANRGAASEHVDYLADKGNDDVWSYTMPVRHALRPDIARAIEAEDAVEAQP